MVKVLENSEGITESSSNNVTLTSEEKVEELIEVIHELQRLPRAKQSNGGVSEKVFTDGGDMRSFYDNLLAKVRIISKNGWKDITEQRKTATINFIRVFDTISIYSGLTEDDRTEETIRVIDMYKTIPEKHLFSDCLINLRIFYYLLSYKVNNILYENIGPFTTNDLNSINNLNKVNEVMWQAAFNHALNYFCMYGNLNVSEGYKVGTASLWDFDLKKWLDVQREDYFMKNKSELQLEHERKLSMLCRDWLGKKYEGRLANFVVKNVADSNTSIKIRLRKRAN